MTNSVKIGPDTWTGYLPMLLLLLEEGATEKARTFARDELQRMAELADLYAQDERKRQL